MVSQAEGLKFGIEHYRRRQPHCSGTLVWQLNDVWPGFSWSVLDHDLLPKAGYHYLRRVFAPVLASFLVDGDALEVWVSNSGRTPASGRLVITLAGFDDPRRPAGGDHGRASRRGSRGWSGDAAGVPLTADRYAWVESPDDLVPANRLFFAEIKDLPFGPSTVRVRPSGPDPAPRGRLAAQGYAYFVHLLTPVPGVRFSDNYLDLRDGDSVVIEVTGLPVDSTSTRWRYAGWRAVGR